MDVDNVEEELKIITQKYGSRKVIYNKGL